MPSFFVFDFGCKNQQNLRFLASKNTSKISPKATQNRCANQVNFLHVFFTFFYVFVVRANPWFCRHGQRFVAFLKLLSFEVVTRFGIKILSKTYPNFSIKRWKKHVQKRLVFQFLLFHVLGCILGALGGPLGLSWDALGAKMAPRSDAILEAKQFFFRFGHFYHPDSDFHQFGEVWEGFWEGFGSVWGWFLEDLAQILMKFGETHHLCLGMAHCMHLQTIALQNEYK